MNWKSVFFAAPLAAALVACPDTKPTPATPDFTIASVAPTSLSFTKLASGDPAAQTVTVTITPTNGFTDAVTLSLVAPAASNGVTGTGTIPAATSSGTVSISATNAANVGDNQGYQIQATSGGITRTQALPISIKDVPAAPQTVTIKSSSTLSGAVIADAANTPFQEYPSSTPFPQLRVGNRSDGTLKGFVSFDLSSLPSTVTVAKIVSVKLVMYQEDLANDSSPSIACDPYATGKLTNATDKLVVESVSYGATFVKSIYATASLSKIGNLSTTSVLESKSLDVTSAVKDDVTNKTVRGNRSQFRLSFPVPYTVVPSCNARFTSATGTPAANQPQLIIIYTP